MRKLELSLKMGGEGSLEIEEKFSHRRLGGPVLKKELFPLLKINESRAISIFCEE